MNPKSGATEILQYPGGFGGRSHYASPLMAEERSGKAVVLGLAFDVTEVVPASAEGRGILESIIRYLLSTVSSQPAFPPWMRAGAGASEDVPLAPCPRGA